MQKYRQHIVFFTGAGISVESGLPTFRDKDGLWKNYDAMELASSAGFYNNPEKVLDFYNERRRNLLSVEPNHAHKVIAELEKDYEVSVITQNVDNLHERAGSTHVIHLHGELTKVTSSANRLSRENIKDYPLDVPIKMGDKAADGSQLRPFVIFFGEYLDDCTEAEKLVKNADIFVVIGTSLVVYPAALFVDMAHHEVPKYLIDPSEMEGKIPQGFVLIQKEALEGIDLFLEGLSKL